MAGNEYGPILLRFPDFLIKNVFTSVSHVNVLLANSQDPRQYPLALLGRDSEDCNFKDDQSGFDWLNVSPSHPSEQKPEESVKV